jgi:hypothetical protein
MTKFNIAVFGDSFADRYLDSKLLKMGVKDESWIQYLEDQDHQIKSYGLSATSTWYSFEQFLTLHEHIDVDAIIFVYSHHGRVPGMPKPYAAFATFDNRPIESLTENLMYQNLSSEDQENILTIIKSAKLTSNETFNLFVQHKIFEEVNKLCREKNIKLVNILPFEYEDSLKDFDLTSAHGDCLYDLIPVVYKEMDVLTFDTRSCHLSLENNTILGKVIVESLNSNSPTNINLNKEVNFVYSEEITNRYLDRYNAMEENQWK